MKRIRYDCPHCQQTTSTSSTKFLHLKNEYEYWDARCTTCGCVTTVRLKNLQFTIKFPPFILN
jgi:transcription elongation factor Elf1